MILYLYHQEKIDHLADDTYALRTEYAGEYYYYRDIACSPDGKWLALASDPKDKLLVIDLPTRSAIQLSSSDNLAFERIAWSNDGQILAAHTDIYLHLWSTTDWQPIANDIYFETGVLSMVWSPDDTRLAIGGTDNKAYIYNAETATIEHTLDIHNDYVRDSGLVTRRRPSLITVSDDDFKALCLGGTGSGKMKRYI